jgi:hypothetical protein
METFTAMLIFEKETPSTIQFQEIGNDCLGESPVCGKLFIKKSALDKLGWQDCEPLSVTISKG